MKTVLKILQITIALAVVTQVVEGYADHERREYELACQFCKIMVSSFEKIQNMTRDDHQEHYDEWLYNIMHLICSGVHESIQNDCYELARIYRLLLRVWWESTMIDKGLYEWLCIDELEVCCPPLHYGKNCTLCDNYPMPCSGHGKCDGDGLRIGDGHCICVKPYSGKNCETCNIGYYGTYIAFDSYVDLICKPCHEACRNDCFADGPQGCHSCAPGWYQHGTECIDVDECTNQIICGPGKYCVNTIGSYDCESCHPACKSCYGPALIECIEYDDYFMFDYFKPVIVSTRFQIITYILLTAFFTLALLAGAILIPLPDIIIIRLVVFLGLFLVKLNIDFIMNILFDSEKQGDNNAINAWNISNTSLVNFSYN